MIDTNTPSEVQAVYVALKIIYHTKEVITITCCYVPLCDVTMMSLLLMCSSVIIYGLQRYIVVIWYITDACHEIHTKLTFKPQNNREVKTFADQSDDLIVLLACKVY